MVRLVSLPLWSSVLETLIESGSSHWREGKLRPGEEKRLRSQAHGGPDPTSATPELFDPAKHLSTLCLSFHMCKMEMLRINSLD